MESEGVGVGMKSWWKNLNSIDQGSVLVLGALGGIPGGFVLLAYVSRKLWGGEVAFYLTMGLFASMIVASIVAELRGNDEGGFHC